MASILQFLGTVTDKIHENPVGLIAGFLVVVVLVLLFKGDTNSSSGRPH